MNRYSFGARIILSLSSLKDWLDRVTSKRTPNIVFIVVYIVVMQLSLIVLCFCRCIRKYN